MATKNVSPITLLAISKFYEIHRLQKRLDIKEAELSTIMKAVPYEDMDEYITRTTFTD